MLTLLTGLAVLASVQSPDTTVAVRRGQRLEVSVHAGSVAVRGWDRDAVRVLVRSGDDAELDIRSRGDRLAVDASGHHGTPADATLEISAPVWMPVTVHGVDLDIGIDGVGAAITAETVQGDVAVRGGADIVTLTSVEGSVRLSGSRGTMQVSSVNDDVTVTDAAGDLSVSTVNGDLALSGIRSGNVDASTVNGDIGFSGSIASGGRYRLSSHNGDLTFAVPEGAGATMNVATFSGDFEAAFPVTVSGMGRARRFSFTIGSGAARVELESFQGDIRLVRPGAANTPR
jgi:DUF4097 and DUF4098 domain-containing protein YvlB